MQVTMNPGRSLDESAEENWRPTGRMRGSLSGHQYTEALRNQVIIQPSQPVQAARPPPLLNTPRPFIPPHFQALMANNNPRPQSGGSSPGSDSSMGGAAAAGDKWTKLGPQACDIIVVRKSMILF